MKNISIRLNDDIVEKLERMKKVHEVFGTIETTSDIIKSFIIQGIQEREVGNSSFVPNELIIKAEKMVLNKEPQPEFILPMEIIMPENLDEEFVFPSGSIIATPLGSTKIQWEHIPYRYIPTMDISAVHQRHLREFRNLKVSENEIKMDYDIEVGKKRIQDTTHYAVIIAINTITKKLLEEIKCTFEEDEEKRQNGKIILTSDIYEVPCDEPKFLKIGFVSWTFAAIIIWPESS